MQLALKSRVRDLVNRISIKNGDVGFMTCAVYDTAWVSMVAKEVQGKKAWLFPECFHYIMKKQLPDGGWSSYAAEVDGILNTSASLLALKAHQQNPYQITEYSEEDFERRVLAGSASLLAQLQTWDVEKADHVGFEILVPTMLSLLEEQGVVFEFPGKKLLQKLNQAKLSRFKVEYLYSPIKTTALHSLEAFVGKLDYDKVRHHKTFGSYMGSPSSTAACLMYSSSWDDESEEYLRWTLRDGAGQGSGGMPSAFPSTYFEVAWVLTTLLEGGFTIEDIGKDQAENFAVHLKRVMEEQKGLMGFAPSVGVDVDDTAKTLLLINLLGHSTSPRGMLDEFECETHFRTYQAERNPSFTANCNALVALLSLPNLSELAPQIEKVASFLSKTWWDSQGAIDDKWNLSEFYPSMLLAEAFSTLLESWDRGDLSSIPTSLITDEIEVSLYQVLFRTLMSQNPNGSWGHENSREVTAYATLTISKASMLPLPEDIRTQISKSIAAAQQFLLSATETGPSYLWVEKVTYGSEVLAEGYVLAALNASTKKQQLLSTELASYVAVPSAKIARLSHECFDSQLFPAKEPWKLQAVYVESSCFRPYLQKLVKNIHPGGVENDKAVEVIPFAWTAYNYVAKQTLSTSKLREEIRESLLRQLIPKLSNGNGVAIEEIESHVKQPANGHPRINGYSKVNGHSAAKSHSLTNGDSKAKPNGNLQNGFSSTLEISAKVTLACVRALKEPVAVTHIPNELTYLLPDGATSNLHNTFVQGTVTSSNSVNDLLASAAKSVFTSYDGSFAKVVGLEVSSRLVINIPGSGAFYELGAYIPPLKEVWFTSTFAKYPSPGQITAYNMSTDTFRIIDKAPYGAGGFYFGDSVYIGSLSPGAGVIAIKPTDLSATTIFNSYFGLPISLADDLVWVTLPSGKRYLYFTSFFTALEPGHVVPTLDRPVTVPNCVWRWDPQEEVLLPVISRLDVPIPNGIRVSPDQKTLYVTDSLSTGAGGAAEGNQGYAPTAGPNIYAFELNNDGFPINKRLFGLARSGYPDGIHVDDAGRVWTAEGEGIVVRSPAGKILGVFNAAAFGVEASDGMQIANFALAGDTLFVAAFDSLYAVKLAEVVAVGQC